MLAEDLSAFLNTAEFSVPATLAGGQEVPVIFDNAYEGGLGGVFEASQPTAIGCATQLQGLEHGSQLCIQGQRYAVAGIQPDGTGMTRLVLERA